jgi:iron complex outermembrane receptor protein
VNLGGLLLPLPFPPGGYVTGVPDLDPTVVENYEISWDRTLPSAGAQLRVTAFHGDSRDMLAVTGESRPSQGLVGLPLNIGNSSTSGIEVSLEGRLRDEWHWGMSYRGQDIDDDFIPGFPVELTLTDFENTTARHVLKANAGWVRDRWQADAYVRYQSRTDGIQGAPAASGGPALLVPIPSYVAVDGRVAYTVNDRMEFALSGRNLTSSEQRQTSGPDVERTLYAVITINFGSPE